MDVIEEEHLHPDNVTSMNYPHATLLLPLPLSHDLSLSLSHDLSLLPIDLSIKQLKNIIKRYGNRIEIKSSQNAIERQQLEEICKICLIRHEKDEFHDSHDEEYWNDQMMISTKYDLVANICHDSIISQGVTIVSEPKPNAHKSSYSADTNVLQNGIYRIHVQNKVQTLSLSLFSSCLPLLSGSDVSDSF